MILIRLGNKTLIRLSLIRLGNISTKRRNNEAKFKNQSTFFKSNNFKSLKNQ